MAKRLLAVCLTLLLLFSLTTMAFADEGDSWYDWDDESTNNDEAGEEPALKDDPIPVFPDVIPGKWYYEDIMALYAARVIDGYTDGSFYPENKVTTGQALKMILLAAGYGEPERAPTTGQGAISTLRWTRRSSSAARSPIWM